MIQYACRVGDRLFAIHKTDNGYGYSFYDEEYHLLDGGLLEDPDISIADAMKDIFEGEGLSSEPFESVCYIDVTEKADAAGQREIQEKREKMKSGNEAGKNIRALRK